MAKLAELKKRQGELAQAEGTVAELVARVKKATEMYQVLVGKLGK